MVTADQILFYGAMAAGSCYAGYKFLALACNQLNARRGGQEIDGEVARRQEAEQRQALALLESMNQKFATHRESNDRSLQMAAESRRLTALALAETNRAFAQVDGLMAESRQTQAKAADLDRRLDDMMAEAEVALRVKDHGSAGQYF